MTIRALNVAAAGLLLAAASGSLPAQSAGTSREGPPPERQRTVRQEAGKLAYWVLPGPRRLSEAVFGTPENPKSTVAPAVEAAKRSGLPPTVPELLGELPFLVGVPLEARSRDEDGGWVLERPTPFGDDARVVEGSFEIVYHDRVREDRSGPPAETPDEVEMRACTFTDPQGHRYRIEVRGVIQPPLPGYETEGGVLIDSVHHGATGTGSPLMPEVKTFAAFWGVGDLYADGERVDRDRVVHMMTTEVVRDRDYRLVTAERLPLPSGERHVAGQEHHTHLVMLPVRVTEKGPVHEPLDTAFELPNGERQPFLHVMFEQDEIVEDSEGSGGTVSVTVTGTEFEFDPDEITVPLGARVEVTFRNQGVTTHNFTIEALGVKSETIHPDQTAQVAFTADEKGTFRIRCKIPGHMQAGMKGELVVD